MKLKTNISDRQIKLIISLLLILSILIAYGKIVNFDFVGYDDQVYVTENIQVQKGITLYGIAWAFTTFHGANWHPLTWLSHMLDCELYGLNPMGHHWVNLIFHMVNTILLFLLLKLMTGAIWRSAFVAALFALHPLHVESVAWVSERKDVLSTFFGLLMIFAYCRYVDKSCFKNYLTVIIFLCLGLMCKPMLVTFPFVLLLLDFWPLKRFQSENHRLSQSDVKISSFFKGPSLLFLEKIPLLIPAFISCLLTFFAQRSEGAVQALETLTLKTRIANALVSYINYILKAIWPSKLSVFYPYPRGGALPVWQIFGAALLIASACFFAMRTAKKYPYITIGLFWYLGTLVPVIGLVQVGDQAMADRYTYIPLIGIFIAVVWGISDLIRKWHYRKIYIGAFAIIILSALASRTFIQISYWKNGVTLFEHAIEVTENNYIAHNNLATALGLIDLERAIFHYKEAVRIHPRYVTALYNLGLSLYHKGEDEEAVSYFTKTIEIKPDFVEAYDKIGLILLKQGKFDNAKVFFSKAIQLNPKYTNAQKNLEELKRISSTNKS